MILFSIIWIIRPISYNEMHSYHPIYSQENVVLVNSSSIPTQNNELSFLEGKGQVQLAKGVEAFPVTLYYPGHPQFKRVPVGNHKPTRAPSVF